MIFDFVSVWDAAAGEIAVLSGDAHAARDVLGEVAAVVLGKTFEHGFEDDSLGFIGYFFGDRHDLDAVDTEFCLIASGVDAIAGEAVELIDENGVEDAFAAVLDHSLELVAVLGFCAGLRAVDVLADDLETVLFGVLHTVLELSLDAALVLPVGRVARVDHGGLSGVRWVFEFHLSLSFLFFAIVLYLLD